MARFNTTKSRPAVSSPIRTDPAVSAVGAGAMPGHARDAQSELFLLAVAMLNVGKDTFYEKGNERTQRFTGLVRKLAVEEPEWTLGFLRWLRTEGNLRSAPVVGAAEFIHARKGQPDHEAFGPAVVDAVLQRADEPGELLAYWTSKYGMALPKGLKKGVGSAVLRLYDEYGLSKYDRDGAGFRFGRVLDLVHPSTDKPWQRVLFDYAHGDMRGRAPEVSEELLMLRARAELTALPVEQRRAVLLGEDGTRRLKAAGMTWEAVSGWLHGPMDADVWTALIPTMGFMALLRNLRNFDQAGVTDFVASHVAGKLADPEQVARSKQFPFRFYSAFKAVTSLRWGHPLEKALQASLSNVPELKGRTLVLVDQSPSMFPGYYFSTKQVNEHIANADLSKLFGSAVALRAQDATLVGYGQTSYRVELNRGDALLKVMERFKMVDGTDTFGAAASHFTNHDRVVIVTDEQNTVGRYTSIDQVVSAHIPVYVWNIGGYQVGSTASGTGTRHTFAGLNDAAFRMIPLLEAGRNASWPWIKSDGEQ